MHILQQYSQMQRFVHPWPNDILKKIETEPLKSKNHFLKHIKPNICLLSINKRNQIIMYSLAQ